MFVYFVSSYCNDVGLYLHFFVESFLIRLLVLAEQRVREREMGLLTNKVERDEIKPGDHIYTYRAVFTYSHHGHYLSLIHSPFSFLGIVLKNCTM